MSKLKIFRASAGSGKTYRLTHEYLKLLFISPDNYKHILAVTFTNKATGEMKSRIIKELAKLAKGDESSYLKNIENEFGLNPEEIQLKAQIILNKLLHDYSRFSVSTIDSFFQSVIRAFAKEIGLHNGFNIELDSEKVLSEVIDRVLIDIDTNVELKNWLIRFAEEKIRDGQSWNFKADINRFGSEVFKEEFQSFSKELMAKLDDKEFLQKYQAVLQSEKAGFEKHMQELGKEALKLMEQNGLVVDDFSYGKAGVAGYLQKISEKTSFTPSVRPRDAINEEDKWYAKKSNKITEIRSAFNNGLNRLLEQAVDHHDRNILQYNTADKILTFLYTLGILTDISRKIRSYAREKNIFLLSDSAKLLNSIIDGNDTPFIYEKIGSIYKHFMIDEFQDTSALQWSNFKPLILNSLAENNTSLVVGDVKQSIYRWRNGDWKLLAEQIEQDLNHQGFETESLKDNWRSKKNVVDFNNAVFCSAPKILERILEVSLPEDQEIKAKLGGLLKKLSNAYSDTFQQIPADKNNSGGYVNCTFIENQDDKKWTDEVMDRLPGLIEKLQDQGYCLSDIAILVRNKHQGRDVANKLLEYKNSNLANINYRYDVVSNESLFTGSASAVRLLLFSLKYFNRPDDMVNLGALLYEYHKITGKENESAQLDQLLTLTKPKGALNFDHLLPECIRSEQDDLRRIPLYELCERLIKLFGLNELRDEVPYIQAFQDLVLNFSRNNISDTDTFLKWWDEEGQTKAISISEEQDAIRILTIHKSKGLEFRVLLIPFCNWSLDHNPTHTNVLWCQPAFPPYNQLELVPVRYGSGLSSSLFYEEYYTEKMQAFVDNLNLLYVAFTRAEEVLYTFSPAPKEGSNGNISDIAGLLFNIFSVSGQSGNLQDLNLSWNPSEKIFELGQHIKVTQDGVSESMELSVGSYPCNEIKEKLKLKQNSRDFFITGGEQIRERVNYGTLMHQIFENVKNENDIDKAVLKAVFEGKIKEDERVVFTRLIKGYLEQSVIKDWFSDEWQVKAEAAILIPTGKTKRPDRVIIKDKKAIVIDYKFVNKESKSHQQQVRDYLGFLIDMGYSETEGFVWYPEMEKVVNIKL